MGLIWTVTAWVWAVGGGVVLVWALFWDRAGWRGRAALRCRGCWYDLTGCADLSRVSKDAPVVCSECGRGHQKIRAMQRTRRKKRWAVVAVVVLVAAGVVGSVPDVRRRGWVGAVPDPVLVLSIPLMSDEPGSSFDWSIWGSGADSGVLKRLEDKIRTTPWSDRLGWLSNRLIFLIARTERTEVLTDSTTTRGSVYMHRIRQIMDQDAAYGFEVDWARSVVYAEFHTRERWAPGTTVHGELKIRRMLLDEYRVEFKRGAAWFEAQPISDILSIGSSAFGDDRPILSVDAYIERDRWDRLTRIARVRHGDPSGDLMVGHGQVRAGLSGPQSETAWVEVYDRSGHSQLGLVWTHAARRTIPFRYVADPDAGPRVVTDRALGARIAAGLAARLGVRFDPASGTWRLVATLSDDGVEVSEPVTIGGRVSIVMGRPDGTADTHPRLLWGPNTWWRIVPPDQQTSRGGGLVWAEHHDGSVSFEEMGTLPPAADADAPLMLLLSWASREPMPIVFADPDVERVFVGVIAVPIRDWTVGELSRYRVSGIVPDHAMP
jgi:hypothetical protein